MTTTPPEASSPPPPGPGEQPGPRAEVRDLGRLRRSHSDRRVAGLCGGLARHLDVDPLVVRVVIAVLVIFGGAGILLYAAGWLLVPEEDSGRAIVDLDERSRTVALVVVAALATLALLGDSFGGWGPPWPVAAVALAVLAVVSFRTPRRLPPPDDPVTQPASSAAPGAVDLAKAPTDATPPHPPYPPASPSSYPPRHPPAPRHRGPVLFWYAATLAALGIGVLAILDLAGLAVPSSGYPAVALGVSAVALLLGAFWGRPGGLIALGLVSALATAGATAADRVDSGRIDAAPTSAAAVADRYDLTLGRIDLDLSDVADPDALDGRTVEVEIGVAGQITVLVPDDVDVVVASRVAAGERLIFGERDAGETSTAESDGDTAPGTEAPELTLDLEVTFGRIQVDREGAS